MANFASIARPYALAAFEYAREKNQLSAWKAFLTSAADTARDKTMERLLADPEIPSAKLYDLFHDVLAPLLNDEQKNFLHLLASNKRLMVLPEIRDQFDDYYAALEKMSAVRVITAIDIEDSFRQTLSQALTRRIEREVTLQCEVDPSILGGAIIHIGDKVIDGSVRGKLTRLLEFSLR